MMEVEKTRFFTFMIEYQGNTLVEQVESGTPDDAIRTWLDVTSAPVAFEEEPSSLREYELIDGLRNVWFLSLLDDQGILFLINIIETAR